MLLRVCLSHASISFPAVFEGFIKRATVLRIRLNPHQFPLGKPGAAKGLNLLMLTCSRELLPRIGVGVPRLHENRSYAWYSTSECSAVGPPRRPGPCRACAARNATDTRNFGPRNRGGNITHRNRRRTEAMTSKDAWKRFCEVFVYYTGRFRLPLAVLWLGILALVAAFGPRVMSDTGNAFAPPPGSPAAAANAAMETHFPDLWKASGIVVVIRALTPEKVRARISRPVRRQFSLGFLRDGREAGLALARIISNILQSCRIAQCPSWKRLRRS